MNAAFYDKSDFVDAQIKLRILEMRDYLVDSKRNTMHLYKRKVERDLIIKEKAETTQGRDCSNAL
jgi:hypothetical protein